MADFNEFFENLKVGLAALVNENWQEFSEAALIDGTDFLETTKEDLKRWTQLLGSGQITREDFEFLVKGKKDLAELEALKQAGLSLVRLQRFQTSLISLVIDTAFGTFA